MYFRALSHRNIKLANSVWGLTFSFGKADAPPKPMPGYIPGFMVINDSDCQRVYMHNAAAEF